MARNPFLQRPWPYREHNLVFWLLGLNLAVFFVLQLWPDAAVQLAMNPLMVTQGGTWWTPLTYMFTHMDFQHLLFNMLGLYFFGQALERHLGSWEFLGLYLVSGLGAGLLSLGFYLVGGQTAVWLLGASGAVYGILLAFAAYAPDAPIFLMMVIPVPARWLVLGYAVVEIVMQFLGGTGIAHLAHLAGFFFSFAYLVFRLRVDVVGALFSRRR